VLALCDIDPKRLHGASRQFSISRATVSFGELLAMPDLDIIDICGEEDTEWPAATRPAKSPISSRSRRASRATPSSSGRFVKS
jgi:hypothetical protein